MMTYLFSDADGRAGIAEIDRLVDALPGQRGLTLMNTAARHYGVRGLDSRRAARAQSAAHSGAGQETA